MRLQTAAETRPRTDHTEELGRSIRERRLARGWTQRELVARAGYSIGALRDLEQGRTRRPHSQIMAALAHALETPVASRLTGEVITPAAVTATGAGLRLRVVGPLAAWRDGVPLAMGEPQQRAVLGMLALNAEAGVTRPALIAALWADKPPSARVNLVQGYVSRLRRVLDAGRPPGSPERVLLSTGTAYRLRLDAAQLDWLAFRDLSARARSAAAAGDRLTGCHLYEQAVRLWHGNPLADIDPLRGHPVITMATRAWQAAVHEYARVAAAAGAGGRVVRHLWTLAERDPFDENTHALLMLAMAADGQRAAALRIFDTMALRLRTHLGVRPGQELRVARKRILCNEISAGLVHVRTPRTGSVCCRPPTAVPNGTAGTDELRTTGGGEPETRLRVRVLGPVSATRDGLALALGDRRQRMVLALLAWDVSITDSPR